MKLEEYYKKRNNAPIDFPEIEKLPFPKSSIEYKKLFKKWESKLSDSDRETVQKRDEEFRERLAS